MDWAIGGKPENKTEIAPRRHGDAEKTLKKGIPNTSCLFPPLFLSKCPRTKRGSEIFLLINSQKYRIFCVYRKGALKRILVLSPLPLPRNLPCFFDLLCDLCGLRGATK
ncbi:MAG: hypothetical protein DRP97_08475 [Candidatus Latescibacterota bacterium]|nr:MAG: hypothetical protein DRP97_08475 [Candidatus Latescibacterota bacterium]